MKDNLIYIEHIIDSINHIKEYTANIVDEEDFTENQQLCDAIVRRIEIIGEASSKISSDFRSKYKQIPWRDIIDTRNLLIHGYFGVSYDEVWNIIVNHIPKLEIEIKTIINDLKENNDN